MDNLTRLKQSLEINKIVDSVSRLKNYQPEDIIGITKSIYLKKCGAFPEDDKYFLIVEGDKAINGLTIMISG